MFVQETIWLPFQFNLRHCQGNEMFRLFFEVGGENLYVACRFGQIFCTVPMIFDRFPITTNLSWTEYSRNLWLGRDVKVNHRSHQLSWVNFAKVHDCSALHVCSFILSILHQADIHDTFLEDTFVIHWCWMDDGVYRRERVQLDVNVLGSWMNLGAICLLKLVLSQCTAFIPLQGIFSVSAFIVSVIYLSRPLWLPLDLQSLKVFDCLKHYGTSQYYFGTTRPEFNFESPGRFKESSRITLHACTWRPLFLTFLDCKLSLKILCCFDSKENWGSSKLYQHPITRSITCNWRVRSLLLADKMWEENSARATLSFLLWLVLWE